MDTEADSKHFKLILLKKRKEFVHVFSDHLYSALETQTDGQTMPIGMGVLRIHIPLEPTQYAVVPSRRVLLT
jgi:hypothetical protein